MKRFKNILVAVDLSRGDHFVSSDLAPPTIEAIERALWLAKLNSARLTFFSSLDVSLEAQRLIREASGENTVLTQANELLNSLVQKAAASNVEAELKVQFGKSWLEIIKHTIQNRNDLVVAGTRHLGSVKGFLMGSTGIKLLRKCPCPVWITQPQPNQEFKTVLVAHCLREVGDTAMDLGCSMAELNNAQLHVLHSMEFPEFDSMLPASIPAERVAQYRAKTEQHIRSQLAKFELPRAPEIHIVTESPDIAVLNHIKAHDVQLVAMGTIARTGIAGFITGNTAERLLPQIPCSVLAVKPSGFVSPFS